MVAVRLASAQVPRQGRTAALGLHAGRRRAVRRLVREITAGPRLALMRACWAALVIATHTPPEQRALINARHAHATRRELRARLHVWRDAPPAPATHKAHAVAHWRSTRREAAVGTWRVVAAEWRVERHGCERADDHAAVQLLRRVIGAWGTHAAKKRRVRGAFSRPSQGGRRRRRAGSHLRAASATRRRMIAADAAATGPDPTAVGAAPSHTIRCTADRPSGRRIRRWIWR